MKTIRSSNDERKKLLGACAFFSGLPDPSMGRLASVMTLMSYEAGEPLFMQGEKAEGFYVVTKGKVKVYRLGTDGREQVLHLFGEGDICGEVPVFQGGKFPASAMAATEVQALYLPGEAFLELGQVHPEIFLEMLAVLSQRLRRFVGLIDDLALKEVSARLAKYLLDLKARAGTNKVELDSTKAMLASRLGTIAETLSRTLNKMQKRQIVNVSGRTIEILDADTLANLAAGMKL